MKPAYEDDRWTPAIGDTVWLNHPDSNEPMGEVIAFVPETAERRKGQPIIKRADGKRVVTHPMFLLPFQYGGSEWHQAASEGRIG